MADCIFKCVLRAFALIFILCGLVFTRVLAVDCQPAPSGIVGWWPGDGNARDIVGTNNGVLQAGATATNIGIVDWCFRFDGVSNYVRIPDSKVLEPATLTVEAWVKFTSLDNPSQTANAGHQYIVFKQNTVTGIYNNFGIAYGLGKDRSPNVPVPTTGDGFYFNVMDSKGNYPEVDATNVIATNVWYHLAGVRGSNFIQLYVNGKFQGQVAATGAQYYNGSWPVYFGTTGQSYWDGKLNGMLDEVSIYNRALSSNEIAAIYNAGAAGKCKMMPPAIISGPTGTAAVAGGTVVFTVGAGGDAPLSYQWYFNGTNAVGLNTNVLALVDVQGTNAGNYAVVVTNNYGSATSLVAALTVNYPPVITNGPVNVAVVVGGNAVFTVGVGGDAPLSYQWYFNGTNAVGLNTNVLALVDVQGTNAGNYAVVVTNNYGSATSSNAVLYVFDAGPVVSVSAGAAPNTFNLSFATQNGLGYHLEFKDDLVSTNDWQELTNVVGDGNVMTLNLSTVATTMRYFRLRAR